jgi:hypothetical protein
MVYRMGGNYLSRTIKMEFVDAAAAQLQRPQVSVPLSVLLTIYSGVFAGAPGAAANSFLTHPAVRLVSIFLMAFIAAKGDRTLAVLSTLAIIVTMNVVNRRDVIADVVGAFETAQDFAADVLKN